MPDTPRPVSPAMRWAMRCALVVLGAGLIVLAGSPLAYALTGSRDLAERFAAAAMSLVTLGAGGIVILLLVDQVRS